MFGSELLLSHVPMFLLVMARVGGVFTTAPLVSSSALPMRAKVLLILGMSAAMYPVLDHGSWSPVQLDLFALVPLMVGEVLLGVSLGLCAMIPLTAAQLAGRLMGQQMGLGLASVLNPGADIEGDSLGQFLYMIALASFFVVGGMELVFGGLVETFARVPAGVFALERAPVDLVASLLTSGFDLAIRLSLPVLAIILLENLAVSFIMKTVPTLNIMSFGFPIRILLGLGVFVAGIGVMHEVIRSDLLVMLTEVEGWIMSM